MASAETSYPYVAIDVAEDEADEAGARLFELGARGVEVRDETTLHRGVSGKVTLWAGFASEDEARAAIGELRAAWRPRAEHVVGDAWRDEWKKHFEPFRICPGIVVAPPWRQAPEGAGERVIVLEPGRAFGTGLHETTRLVATILAERAASVAAGPVLDVGCGSGILALVALALGAPSARAVDVDPEAVGVTRENAKRNGVTDRLAADDDPVAAVPARYPTVVANIECAPLVAMAPDLAPRVAPGGLLILSGLLAEEVAPSQLPDIRRAYAEMTMESVRRDGEWIAVVLRAPAL
ncbi:MAG TPA: 50S ribosomal protein L11 methyltransferase [Polyangiaceae bacterium]|nr:50S ribosomal protein L11 methyltransferase [Polyangiaceae bacterium]